MSWACGVFGMIRAGCIRRLGLTIAVALQACAGCGPQGDQAGDQRAAREPGPIRVVVSIPPLAGLVRSIVPEGSEVQMLVAAGQSPHGYEPRPSDIAAIARADLVVLVGMGVESSLPVSVRSGDRVLEMAGALGLDNGAADAHSGHDHAHGAGDADPHLWLDPRLVERFVPKMAERVRESARSAGVNAQSFDSVGEREAELLASARDIDSEYRRRLQPFAGAAIITQHAAWSRVAERYGLEVVGVIQSTEDVEPSPGHIAEVIAAGTERRVRGVFTEAQLDARTARRVAERIGVQVGLLDPLGHGDWAAMMLANLDEFTRVIGSGTQPESSPAVGRQQSDD